MLDRGALISYRYLVSGSEVTIPHEADDRMTDCTTWCFLGTCNPHSRPAQLVFNDAYVSLLL